MRFEVLSEEEGVFPDPEVVLVVYATRTDPKNVDFSLRDPMGNLLEGLTLPIKIRNEKLDRAIRIILEECPCIGVVDAAGDNPIEDLTYAAAMVLCRDKLLFPLEDDDLSKVINDLKKVLGKKEV